MAKNASMFRPSKELGIFNSRYCIKPKKNGKGCKKYAYYKANACNTEDWMELRAARYVLVPISEL